VQEGGKVSSQLKSEKVEVMVEPAGEVACVIKVIVQYEKDGGELPPEDQGARAGVHRCGIPRRTPTRVRLN
jgi:hypothetical protein